MKSKIAYHVPSSHSIYSMTIQQGYASAFRALGYEFEFFTEKHNLKLFFEKYNPDIFLTSSHFFYRKSLDFNYLKELRKEGLVLLTKIDFWNSPMDSLRLNEAPSMSIDSKAKDLIQSDLLGDFFFHVVEQGDERMSGFKEFSGVGFHTIPLASDYRALASNFDTNFAADISYIGSYLPEKREFFKSVIFPLKAKYKSRFYGQDWTRWDRIEGTIQKIGQYLNIEPLASIRKPRLKIQDEYDIYRSSKISINVHEEYQKKFGGDCNERTFKIPLSGGFQIVDDVATIAKYFDIGKEIIIGNDAEDYLEKLHHFMRHDDQRTSLTLAGKNRVIRDHTYLNRVRQIIAIARTKKPKIKRPNASTVASLLKLQ